MSLKTWLKEFYPTPAENARTLKRALKHDERKRSGFLRKNRRKHKIKYEQLVDHFEKSGFDTTCALCRYQVDNYDIICNGTQYCKAFSRCIIFPCLKDFNKAVSSTDPSPAHLLRRIRKEIKRLNA